MESKIIRGVIVILANALGLLTAAVLVSEFSISLGGFVTAVVLFTLATAVMSPLLQRAVEKGAPQLLGGIALLSTLLALVVTNWLSDGLSVTSTSAWIVAAVIIWVVSVAAGLVLPKLILSRPTETEKSEQSAGDTKESDD